MAIIRINGKVIFDNSKKVEVETELQKEEIIATPKKKYTKKTKTNSENE